MFILAAAQDPPWWAVPSFTAGGAILGALIALISAWIVASREMGRREKVARREVYARLIERAVRLRETCDALSRFTKELESMRPELAILHERFRESLVKPTLESQLRSDVREQDAKADLLRGKVDRASEEAFDHQKLLALTYYELSLYASPAIRREGSRLVRVMAVLHHGALAGDPKRLAAMQNAASNAIADFTVLARADVRSPGARGMLLTRIAVTRRRKKDEADEARRRS